MNLKLPPGTWFPVFWFLGTAVIAVVVSRNWITAAIFVLLAVWIVAYKRGKDAEEAERASTRPRNAAPPPRGGVESSEPNAASKQVTGSTG